MTNKFLSALVLFLLAQAVVAQKITEKDLIGVWQIKTADFELYQIDFDKKEVELHNVMSWYIEEDKSIDELKEELWEGTSELGGLKVEFFKGYKVKYTDNNGVLEEGNYTIVKKDNGYALKWTDSDNGGDDMLIEIKKGLMYWIMSSEDEKEVFIFKKIK